MAFLYKFPKKQTSRERYVSNITQWRLAEKILKSDFSSNKSSCNALNTLYLEKKHNFPIDLVKTPRALILWACYSLRFLLITLAPKVLLEDLWPMITIPSHPSILHISLKKTSRELRWIMIFWSIVSDQNIGILLSLLIYIWGRVE